MLAPSLPLLRLPDRGTADRNPNQPITARKSHRCSLSQATKAFLDELHEFSRIAGTMVCDTRSPASESRTRRFART